MIVADANHNLSTESKFESIFKKAAALLPAEAGDQLLAFITPAALTTLVIILVAWAGSHFFGVGEVADLLLLAVGYIALGGIALEAAQHLASCIKLGLNASSENELDAAAKHLATAITLVGVQAVLTILFRKKPGETFKTVHGRRIPSYSKAYPHLAALPKTNGLWYRPKLIFTRKKDAGTGATSYAGDIRIGRFPGVNGRSEIVAAISHEKVHQFFSPKFFLLREIRIYLKQSAYSRSFLLRYIEEALAETVGLLAGHGWKKENIFKGLIFPLNGHYNITISQMRAEAGGILLGPITVGSMIFNVFYALNTD